MIDATSTIPVGSPCADGLGRAFAWPEPPAPAARPEGLRIAFQPDDVKNGLGRLVLTVIELLRELLERQAMRRIEAGSLTEPEIERIGLTFLRLSEQMETLKAAFGLEGQELNLDLGSLGKLLDG